MTPSRLEIENALGDTDVEIEDVLRAASDEEIRREFVRRRLSIHTADRREAAGCVIDAEDLDEARSLLGRHRRTEALLVIERGLPRDFAGAFCPTSPGRYHP